MLYPYTQPSSIGKFWEAAVAVLDDYREFSFTLSRVRESAMVQAAGYTADERPL